ncbi:cobyrinic acid a,c-diamide synthase [Sulfurifustis variabilis]|uniref:Cobyrinic acid a,c-diamide synthase n=1 Tax=Sulfurifustis variabilis TaxID=1675686 RepID=A0A1C7AFJ4_9GAMM|nr:AAA family ATPase [Sulfurifustis variabilis]BAU50108.1 cobyrinic acid a,c-diamide synthase [Sulfurifustis variabilis]
MRTIMLLNSKGGCGKSTLATNLAAHYATQNRSVVLADFDRQGSSLEWLAARPEGRPPIKGVAAWKEPLRVPRNTDYVILDVPAGCHGAQLTALVRRAQTLLIPVLPSPTDIRAAAHFIHELLLVGKVVRKGSRVAVIANRVRENSFMQGKMEQALGAVHIPYATVHTHIYRNLERFLLRLKIPFIATLRDTPNYQLADEQGLGIFELGSRAAHDVEQWQPLLRWLESRKSLPVAA